ncbi:hypothetical protein [Clostridium formicaceticum]|uniref:Uncharacterized protein n=1 Tax=Clostridium formicaceticum TaxID=1497 RepID=A0AAC9RN82_9CLOT|nr:hypothetical protein [Clostridium formicaceticum]AOY77729.1 hypothetical protein BJL90_18825 [Clostridium formicaceticum]ARE88323.1 hypothetical protein CLFO_27240 [Clostridium formicaceticum]
MKLSEKFSDGRNYINKTLWIILIPILLDVFTLLTYQYIYQVAYVPIRQLFTWKIGIISTPPSVRFILEDFPSVILQYNHSGFTGIINELSLFNVFLAITLLLVISFIQSGYLSVLSSISHKNVGVKDFFVGGNRFWFKFFLFQTFLMYPFLLMFIKRGFVYLAIVNTVFFYVKYSIVLDEGSIRENFSKGVAFFWDNIDLSIKMAFYFGFVFSLLSIVIYLMAGLGLLGIIIAIVLTAYFGAAINKSVLEIYRDTKEKATG